MCTKNYGKLIYLTLAKHVKSFAVQTLAQFMLALPQEHFKLCLRLLRYLRGSLGKGVHIENYDLKLSVCVDSDYGKSMFSRRYVTGFVCFLVNSPVS